MSTTDEMTVMRRFAAPAGARRRAREFARGALWRLAPGYARRRSRRLGTAATVERLQDELKQTRERHGEQIERLEDLVRELVLAVEALRRQTTPGERRDEA